MILKEPIRTLHLEVTAVAGRNYFGKTRKATSMFDWVTIDFGETSFKAGLTAVKTFGHSDFVAEVDYMVVNSFIAINGKRSVLRRSKTVTVNYSTADERPLKQIISDTLVDFHPGVSVLWRLD